MTEWPFLASGRDADVYALDARRVLRRYRDGGDVADEAAVMGHVRRHGFPVPEVYLANGTDLVMQRLYGPTMLHALVAGELDVALSALILAEVAVDPGHGSATMASAMLAAFLGQVESDPSGMVADAVALRRVDPALSADEIDRLDAAAALIRDAGDA